MFVQFSISDRLLDGLTGDPGSSGTNGSEGTGGASGAAGQYGNGGGLYALGNATIVDSVIQGNTAYNGGGLFNSGRLVDISSSTLADNQAVGSLDLGYGSGGGAYNDGGTLNILGSLLSGNTAADNTGGALINANSAITNIANSTFSGNRAEAASYGSIVHNSSGQLAVSNCTLIANTSSSTLWNESGATASVKNTIIAQDSAASCQNDGTLASSSNNFVDFDCGGSGSGTIDRVGTVSNVGALANNGGKTYTHALENDSNAVDAGVDCTYISNGTNPLFSNGATVAVDQRKKSRDDLACDMGAFELQLTDPNGDSVIKEVHGTGVFTFGPTRVQINVTDIGSGGGVLNSLTVTRIGGNHSHATGVSGGNGVGWNEYWTIETNLSASGFLANLTLPALYTPNGDTRVCRYTGGAGAGWDCSDQNDGYTSSSVTRDDVAAFSDWAVGYAVTPTAIRLNGASARPALPASNGAWIASGLVLGLLALGGLTLRRRTTRKTRE